MRGWRRHGFAQTVAERRLAKGGLSVCLLRAFTSKYLRTQKFAFVFSERSAKVSRPESRRMPTRCGCFPVDTSASMLPDETGST